MSIFTVRPSNSEKEVFRVRLTATSLLLLKVKPGDVVLLQLPDDTVSESKAAIAWDNSGTSMKDNIVQTSKALQELYGFKLGDKIGITRSNQPLKSADTVSLRCVSGSLSNGDMTFWQVYLSAVIPSKHDVLGPRQLIHAEVGKKKEEFEVVVVGGLLARITDSTQFSLEGSPSIGTTATDMQFDFNAVGGLRSEIKLLTHRVRLLLDGRVGRAWSGFQAQHGILLYGLRGTGKTLLQETLALNGWGSVVRWTPGIKPSTPIYPQLIIADICDLNSTSKGIAELMAIFRDVKGTQTIVIGETRDPNDVPERLRNMFSVELELQIPDSTQRLDILRVLRRECHQPSDEQLTQLANRTRGFVGGDLKDLLHEMWSSADSRHLDSTCVPRDLFMNGSQLPPSEGDDRAEVDSAFSLRIIQADIDLSLSQIRPSALPQVFLEKPNVRWNDIGGQHTLKHQLTTAVARTLSPTLRKRMINLGLEVTKGVLLYGPPGCSKTLLAKALATQADLNFLAVKGAELISMYVGESERATREVFRKARTAAPSILFFDEIDAIASRHHGGSGNLNVLTTLLNEMDGFEVLRNVIIVAATNKPQDIDPALLRPGRFDHVVYVGLPDNETRREIFEKRFCNISVRLDVVDAIPEWTANTEGYSGAEVVAICKAAGESAMDDDRDEITVEDVRSAITNAPKGITKDMIDEYTRWNDARKAIVS